MLKFCSLYSGSTGNSLFVQSDNTKILIDSGVSAKKLIEALSFIDVDINCIDCILVTHEHIDHVQSLGTISRNYNIPVYANEQTWLAMPKQSQKISDTNKKNFCIDKSFIIGDLKILPFSIPHDAANPCGFSIFNNDKKITIATDIGHITPYIESNLQDSSFVLLESNYEPDVLKYSSYPFSLKERIAGPIGHLSNDSASNVIVNLFNKGLKNVMLGHLSKENNFPELAYKSVIEKLVKNNLSEKDINLSIASRNEPSKFIEIG